MTGTTKKEQDNDEDENKNSNNKRIQALEAACQEKEDVIQHLEQQLNEQVCAIKQMFLLNFEKVSVC